MDNTDGFAHTGDVILENGEKKEHITSADCWCQPIRQRYNGLTRVWEAWNRETFAWEALEPQPPAPLDRATAEALRAENIKVRQGIVREEPDDTLRQPPMVYDVVSEMEGRDADREAGRYEDYIKRHW